MKIAYFDCIAGASGDMMLGALVDAGLSPDVLRERLAALHLADFELRVTRVAKHAFAATKVDVLVRDDAPERHLGEIERIVQESDLAPDIKARACAIFRRIGTAEAAIHNASVEHVHLHELGGVDTIVDVVGALVGLDALGIERVVVSPVPLGRGFVHGAHGQIPLPAPATVALLKGVPVVGSPLQMETVTPTGAALLSSLAAEFGPIPAMTLEAVGYGAGSKDLPIPNVLRVLIGTVDGRRQTGDGRQQTVDGGHGHSHPHAHEHDHAHSHSHTHEHPHAPHSTHYELPTSDSRLLITDYHLPTPDSRLLTTDYRLPTTDYRLLETNLDDLNPEFYGYIMDKLFAAGALDVFFTPIQMKKNRPGTLLSVLCEPEQAESLRGLLFAETSTLGIREHTVARYALPRRSETVETRFGPVRVKIAELGDGRTKSAPEYEDCRRLAEQHGVPLREVYAAALCEKT